MEFIVDFFNDNFWAAISLIACLTVPLTTLINDKLNIKKVWKQIASWGVAFVLTTICYFLNVVHIGGPVWFALPITGLVVGLSSNGIYDIPSIKTFINKYLTSVSSKQSEKA